MKLLGITSEFQHNRQTSDKIFCIT